MTADDRDPAADAFLRAGDAIRKAIEGLPGRDARVVLSICLAECIVYGSEDDEHNPAFRLAHTVGVLGDSTSELIAYLDYLSSGAGADYDSAEDPRPSPSDLLRKFLERRLARDTKEGE